MIFVKAYGVALAAFLALDMLWLGVVARSFYAGQLGHLMRDSIDYPVAALFYVLYVGGIVYFAVAPALSAGSVLTAALNGAVFGLLAYGTYDMTNLATLKDWPVAMSVVDMAWGGAITAATAVIAFLSARALS